MSSYGPWGAHGTLEMPWKTCDWSCHPSTSQSKQGLEKGPLWSRVLFEAKQEDTEHMVEAKREEPTNPERALEEEKPQTEVESRVAAIPRNPPAYAVTTAPSLHKT